MRGRYPRLRYVVSCQTHNKHVKAIRVAKMPCRSVPPLEPFVITMALVSVNCAVLVFKAQNVNRTKSA